MKAYYRCRATWQSFAEKTNHCCGGVRDYLFPQDVKKNVIYAEDIKSLPHLRITGYLSPEGKFYITRNLNHGLGIGESVGAGRYKDVVDQSFPNESYIQVHKGIIKKPYDRVTEAQFNFAGEILKSVKTPGDIQFHWQNLCRAWLQMGPRRKSFCHRVPW